jgi:hypothetical protein
VGDDETILDRAGGATAIGSPDQSGKPHHPRRHRHRHRHRYRHRHSPCRAGPAVLIGMPSVWWQLSAIDTADQIELAEAAEFPPSARPAPTPDRVGRWR